MPRYVLQVDAAKAAEKAAMGTGLAAGLAREAAKAAKEEEKRRAAMEALRASNPKVRKGPYLVLTPSMRNTSCVSYKCFCFV